MTIKYNFKWKWFTICVCIWLILSIHHYYSSNGFFAVLIMMPLSLLLMLIEISEVTITDTQIKGKYALPFRKIRTVSLDEIKAYNEVHEMLTFSKKPTGGKITPREGEQIMIHARGIHKFKELNQTLSERYPSLPFG